MSDSHAMSEAQLGAPYHGGIGRTLLIFAVIIGLMAIEVALAMTRVEGSALYNPAMSFSTLLWALTALASTNALVLLFFFMNLQFETKTMRAMVGISFLFPIIYALVLISEAVWRHL